jgi:hypothetical protein
VTSSSRCNLEHWASIVTCAHGVVLEVPGVAAFAQERKRADLSSTAGDPL